LPWGSDRILIRLISDLPFRKHLVAADHERLSCAGLRRPVRIFRVVAKIMFPNFTLGSGVFTQAPFRQKRQ
jgi:hypothetical protein